MLIKSVILSFLKYALPVWGLVSSGHVLQGLQRLLNWEVYMCLWASLVANTVSILVLFFFIWHTLYIDSILLLKYASSNLLILILGRNIVQGMGTSDCVLIIEELRDLFHMQLGRYGTNL